MKLIPVNYFGFTAMDRRFSSPMLPWIVSEIRKREFSEKVWPAGAPGLRRVELLCKSVRPGLSGVERRKLRRGARGLIVFCCTYHCW